MHSSFRRLCTACVLVGTVALASGCYGTYGTYGSGYGYNNYAYAPSIGGYGYSTYGLYGRPFIGGGPGIGYYGHRHGYYGGYRGYHGGYHY